MKNNKRVLGSFGKPGIHLALLLLAMAALPAHAVPPTATKQSMDRVFAFTSGRVLDMATGNAAPISPFTDEQIAGGNFITCALTAVKGLYCLDGADLRNWINPDAGGTGNHILYCDDSEPGLGLDRKAVCTGMTVDESNDIWLAGKKRNTHSVIKVVAVESQAACLAKGGKFLPARSLCALELYFGRPPLADITPIDGEAAKAFPTCSSCSLPGGVLAVEERKSAVFYPDLDAVDSTVKPVTLVGPKEWGLLAKEELQEVTLLQLPLPAGLHNYIAAVTSKGRILIKDVADPLYPTVYQAYAMPGSHLDTQSSCPSQASAQQYGIRASTTADILYVSDRNFCQVLVLKPSWNSSTLKLNLTMTNALSTSITGAVYYTIGLTVAPGITVLLTDCDDGCTLANSTAGASAATLQGLEVNQNDGGGISYGATVFQIKGIPDCRYDGYNGFNFETALHTLCSQPGVHVYANPTTGMPDPTLLACPPGNSCPPVAQWLNVTPLLPLQVTQAYEAKGYGPLPPLLISPPYRGQSLRGNLFEALFVLTDRGVRYINNFVGEYKVQLLEGGTVDNRVRCDRNADAPLAWDLVTDVSEFHVGYGMQHVDMLTNIDCGSIKDMGTRMSLLPYNLEPAPDTWGVRFGGTTPSLTLNNDAVYARLVQRLYDELGYVQHNLACNHVDPVYNDAGEVVPDGRTPPLSASNCSSLDNTWAVGKDKLNKCIDSAFQPKTSFGDQNCNAFLSQVNNFKALLPSTTPEGDVANRVGELWARITVMMHVYDKRFVPSITAVGYCVESNRCTSP